MYITPDTKHNEAKAAVLVASLCTTITHRPKSPSAAKMEDISGDQVWMKPSSMPDETHQDGGGLSAMRPSDLMESILSTQTEELLERVGKNPRALLEARETRLAHSTDPLQSV